MPRGASVNAEAPVRRVPGVDKGKPALAKRAPHEGRIILPDAKLPQAARHAPGAIPEEAPPAPAELDVVRP